MLGLDPIARMYMFQFDLHFWVWRKLLIYLNNSIFFPRVTEFGIRNMEYGEKKWEETEFWIKILGRKVENKEKKSGKRQVSCVGARPLVSGSLMVPAFKSWKGPNNNSDVPWARRLLAVVVVFLETSLLPFSTPHSHVYWVWKGFSKLFLPKNLAHTVLHIYCGI